MVIHGGYLALRAAAYDKRITDLILFQVAVEQFFDQHQKHFYEIVETGTNKEDINNDRISNL